MPKFIGDSIDIVVELNVDDDHNLASLFKLIKVIKAALTVSVCLRNSSSPIGDAELASERQDKGQDIIQHLSAANIPIMIDTSEPTGIDLANSGRDDLAGVVIGYPSMTNPVALREAAVFGVPVTLEANGAPLIDLFEVMDGLGSETEINILLENAPSDVPPNPDEAFVPDPEFIRWNADIFRGHDVASRIRLRSWEMALPENTAQVIAAGSKRIFVAARAASEPAMLKELFENLYSVEVPETYAAGRELELFGTPRDKSLASPGCAVRAVADMPKDTALEMADSRLEIIKGAPTATRPIRISGRKLSRPLSSGETIRDSGLQPKVGTFLQSRVASSRLPRKALRPFIDGMTTIEYLIHRLKSYDGEIGQIVLATTQRPEDDELQAIAENMGIDYLRGADDDVLGRMVQAVDQFDWDVLVRVTGDDQFTSCEYIEKAVEAHLTKSADFTRVVGLPVGMNCEVLDARTLRRIHRSMRQPWQGEYVTWFFDSDWICRFQNLEVDTGGRDSSNFRVTLDYPEDYDLMRQVAELCAKEYPGTYVPTDKIISALFEIDPDWIYDETRWPYTRGDVVIDLGYSHN